MAPFSIPSIETPLGATAFLSGTLQRLHACMHVAHLNATFYHYRFFSTDSFRYAWECFGIDPLVQLIQERQDKFIKKYSACDNNRLCLVICRH